MDYSAFPRYLESPARHLFRRCVQCPDTTPSCPTCAENEECSFIPTSCDACASSKCIVNPNAKSSSSSSSSPAGPIAGGVIGGLLLVVAVVGLLWFFYIRKRRQQAEAAELANLKMIGEDEQKPPSEHLNVYSERSSKRGSARSVFTTGSNLIQIAYIPGVTGTAGGSPDMVPPVPPIPAAGTTSPHLNTGADQYFLPDLRPDSTYGGDRKSYRSTARSSIAPSEYHDAIVDPMPARQAIATRAVPISVRSNSRGASPQHSPPLSHQGSIAGRMGRPPMSGHTGQAKQVMITRSSSNLNRGFAHEMEDTSPASTPRIGLDRSGTASPRSMLSEDDGRSGHRPFGGRSPGSPQPPVSAVRSEFSQSRGSPVSNYGWDNQHANIRNTIRDAALLGYGQQPAHTLHEIAELDSDTHSQHTDPKSPFGDRHAT